MRPVMNSRLPLAVASIAVLALLLPACSSDDATDGTASTTTAAPSTTTIVEIESEEAMPIDIDVSDQVIAPDPEAPPDEFAVGESTPRDPKGRPYLSPGDEGDDVAALQRRLIELGYAVEDSGVYDDETL